MQMRINHVHVNEVSAVVQRESSGYSLDSFNSHSAGIPTAN